MKRNFIFFISLLSGLTLFAQRNIDVTHYSFEINLTDSSDMIRGRAEITLKALSDISSIDLDLIKEASNGKGMSVMAVNDEQGKLVFAHKDDRINIIFPKGLKTGAEKKFVVSYQGIPNDGLIISKNKFGNRTFFADNWPNRARNWIPCVDDPADKASVEFIVTAPSHYQVVSNGILIEETDLTGERKISHWKEDIALPTKIMVIGVAAFSVGYAGNAGPVPVYTWVYPENKEKGFYDYGQATEILTFLSSTIAPFPYPKLANVQSKTIFGGMENAGAIFYEEGSVTGRHNDESLLAHEITHQWFGDMATEKSFPHLWLSEGFATYFAHYYIAHKYGKDSMNAELRKDRNQVIGFASRSMRPIVDSVTTLMGLLNENSYQKGGWVLHMLSRELGDSLFLKCIRAYYEEYKGRNASTDDFRKVIEGISGKNFESFFHQWLYTPGLPILNISWKYDDNQKTISLNIEQTQANGPFQFPLEIAFDINGDMSKVEKIEISKPSESFSFPVIARPKRIVLDPNTSLLFDGRVKEER